MMSPGSNVMYWLTCEMIVAPEDHGARVAALHALAVDVEPNVQRLRVATSSGVTSQGPIGPRCSKPCPCPLRGGHLEGALQKSFTMQYRRRG